MTIDQIQALVDEGESGAQVQIWIEAGKPLCQKDWEANGYVSLPDYVLSLRNESAVRHQKKYEHLPLCSLGAIDMKTGEKKVFHVFESVETLPTETIADLLTFNDTI